MKKYEWIFLDLDGTLADSINILYDKYIQFLKEFGFVGTKDEFNILNGPSLKEIISILKKKYNLLGTELTLLKNYENKIESAYKNSITLIPTRFELLFFLKDQGIKLALVTSLSKKLTMIFLIKNNLEIFFDVIISGDDVKKSKPHPEIYTLCLLKTQSNKNTTLVLEDSKNGYDSAIASGLKCEIIKNKTPKEISSLFT